MSGSRVDVHAPPLDLADMLEPDETLLWSGAPGHGQRLFQAVGAERVWHIGFLIGIAAIWVSYPFIEPDRQNAAQWVFCAATAAFAGASFFIANQRQYLLRTLAYLVTDTRAMICRQGRNWHLGDRLYVVSFPHSATYPYRILQGRPYPSLRIGDLLSADSVQPFGIGLAHPGQPYLWNRTSAPAAFDLIPEAGEVLNLIVSHAGDRPAGMG